MEGQMSQLQNSNHRQVLPESPKALKVFPIVFLDMDDVLCLDSVQHSGLMLKIFEQTIPDYPEMWARLVDPGAAENLRQLHSEFTPQYLSLIHI